MPDPITASFRRGWRLATKPAERETPTFLSVLLVQEAWRQLTRLSQAALLAVAEKPGRAIHPNTAKSLRAHGLIDEHNQLTFEGRAVVKHRPQPGKHAAKDGSDG